MVGSGRQAITWKYGFERRRMDLSGGVCI